jgi:HAE1 family hydrophobic/amphiphilic exporter-1
MATTFSLVVIFLPVSFMSSVSGRFLYQFGVTAAVSVMVSLLVSFTLTPMMSARLLRAGQLPAGHGHGAHEGSRGGFYAWIDRGYAACLRGSMRHRWLIVAISLGVIAATGPIYGWVKQEYTPSDVDEGEFEGSINGPEGISLAAMDEAVRAIEGEIRKARGVRAVLITGGGGFLGRVSQGSIYVRIAPHEERTVTLQRLWRGVVAGDPLAAFRGNYNQREVMQEVRQRLRKFRDFRILIRNIPGFNIGGGSFEIDFVLRGPDLEALAQHGETLRSKAIAMGGFADVDTTLRLDRPEFRVRIDRARAADLRVDNEQIATALRLMVGGDQEVSRFRDATTNEDYYVQLRLSEKDRGDPSTISRLWVARQDEEGVPRRLVRLDNLVQIVPGLTASRIDRSDRQREVRIRASVAPGYGQADRIAALRQAVAEMNLPAAYTTAVSGRARELEKAFVEFLWVFLLSVVFMYMILAAQFESLIHPFTILLSLPLSVPFALLSLWYTANTLNLYSALGILVLFGVVKKNAILQIDHMNNLRAEGLDRGQAVMQGNRDRLRPILMTTLALVAGMLPLWLGTGPGAEERRAIAVVVIGGQTLALLLTLLVTPVAYSLFEDVARALGRVPTFVRRGPGLSRRLRRRRRGKAAHAAAEHGHESPGVGVTAPHRVQPDPVDGS